VNQLYQIVLQNIGSLVCSVGLWRRLGNNKQPENQKVTENKEEANKGNRPVRPYFAEAGVDQMQGCDMLDEFHLI
jgi:hypothetical protein